VLEGVVREGGQRAGERDGLQRRAELEGELAYYAHGGGDGD
jgi:hypothetical protein